MFAHPLLTHTPRSSISAPEAGECCDGAAQSWQLSSLLLQIIPSAFLNACSKRAAHPVPAPSAKITFLLITRLNLAAYSEPTSNRCRDFRQEITKAPRKSHCSLKESFRASHPVIFSEDELPPAPCIPTCLGTSTTLRHLSTPPASTALPQGTASTHDFRDEEYIWECRQDCQATGQSAGGS